jgi:hypothetical protein
MKPLTNLIAVLLVVLAAILAGCDSSKELPPELQRDTGTVVLEVDFGEEKRPKSVDVVCSPDSTVLLSLERAQQLNKITFKHRGTGETVFVTSIDGIENEGGDGKNWIYKVNGKLGDKSAGVFFVKPGDKISWSFGSKPPELN